MKQCKFIKSNSFLFRSFLKLAQKPGPLRNPQQEVEMIPHAAPRIDLNPSHLRMPLQQLPKPLLPRRIKDHPPLNRPRHQVIAVPSIPRLS